MIPEPGPREATLYFWYLCMADFGLEVTNDGGTIQIDSVNVNFEVIATGSTAGPASGFTINSISFTSCPNPPMVFVRTTGSGYTYFVSWILSGSNYVGAKFLVLGNITVNYFVAAPQITSSSDTWGLHIFNAAGAKVFDSGKPYLKIIDAFRIGSADGFGGITFSGGTFSHATTPQPYYCLGGGNSYILDDGSDLWQCGPAVQSNGTSSVVIDKTVVDTISVPGSSLGYSITANISSSFQHRGEDSIFQIPVIVGALGV